jgi:hypothetical protein
VNDIDIETMLYELLQDEEAVPEVKQVQTFEEAGVLTRNRGVVVQVKDGAEWQITIVQSRHGR